MRGRKGGIGLLLCRVATSFGGERACKPISFYSLLYPAHETAASNASKAKPAPWPFSALSASFAELGARLRQPGRARLILLHLRIRS